MAEKKNSNQKASRFFITYRITVQPGCTIEKTAHDITIEQTVEAPLECIPPSHYERGIVGIIENITCHDEPAGIYDVVISYHNDIVGKEIPQFLNVLFGNISLKNNICVLDIELNPSLESIFPGPSYGIEGVRRILGVFGRTLACTPLKPLGLDIDALAGMAHQFALGGADLIKDDHGLSNQQFHPFYERVARCQEAVSAANMETGRNTVYCPMISGRFDEIEQQVQLALSCGVQGVLIAPMLVGFDSVRYIAETYKPIIIAHPALTGTFFHDEHHGIAPSVLLGTLFRYLGADISVFPNAGGRFCFTQKQCDSIADELRKPRQHVAPAFPCPAGGMQLSSIQQMREEYGNDTVLLIGGAVMKYSRDLRTSTQKFMEEIRACGSERLEKPEISSVISCELPLHHDGKNMSDDLLQWSNFRWTNRTISDYKSEEKESFKGITRQGLTGNSGEKALFDLRYFEIEPGGFSSLERHNHEHVVIGARGEGILVKSGKRLPVKQHDIAYIQSMQAHQLLNEGTEPFGFYCIVDHQRDRPMKIVTTQHTELES